MNEGQVRLVGILCLIACLICIFVAVERYSTNASNVRAIAQSPLGGLVGEVGLKPATPAATKYAVFFALLFGVGGIVALNKAKKIAIKPRTDDSAG